MNKILELCKDLSLIRIPRPGYVLRPFWPRSRRRNVIWSSEEIEAVLAHHDLGHWQVCHTFAGGSSDNVSLRTSKGKKLLKRYFLPLPSTMYEHSILGRLADADFPTPRLDVNNEGLTYTELGDRHYAVYDFVDGYCYANYFMPIKSRRPLVAQAGDTLARFHQLIEGFVPEGSKFNGFMFNEHRLWRDVPWHLDVLEQYAKETAKKRSLDNRDKFLLNIIDEVRDDLIEVGRYYERPDPQLPKRIIHGDYSPMNILFNQSKIAAVLDFGDADLNLRALDLARGLTSFAPANDRRGVDERLARVFLLAYQAREPLSKKEVEAIPDLIRWRYLQNIIWPLTDFNPYRGEPKPSVRVTVVRDRWEGARWMKDHGDELRASLLSMS